MGLGVSAHTWLLDKLGHLAPRKDGDVLSSAWDFLEVINVQIDVVMVQNDNDAVLRSRAGGDDSSVCACKQVSSTNQQNDNDAVLRSRAAGDDSNVCK